MARKTLPLQKYASSSGFSDYCFVEYDNTDPDTVKHTCIFSTMSDKMPIGGKWYVVLSMVVNGNGQYIIQIAWPIDVGGVAGIYARSKNGQSFSEWRLIVGGGS